MPQNALETVRPTYVCQALLAALDASEGRRRKRDRLGAQRPNRYFRTHVTLPEQVTWDDPEPQTFEAWLLQCAISSEDKPQSPGAGDGHCADCL